MSSEFSRTGQIDFVTLFESAPGLYLVLAPDFTIVAVTDSYLAATMTRRREIIGRNLFEVFPDNPNDPAATGARNLRASLERVLAKRQPDTMAVQKYDIQRPAAEGGGFEERYWSPNNSPVFGPDGSVAYIVHSVQDVTSLVKLERSDAEGKRRSEEVNSKLAAIVEHTDDAIVSEDLSGNITSWNAAAERLFGYAAAEALGRNVSLLAPPDRTKEAREFLGRLQSGENAVRAETVRKAKDGRLINVAITLSPIKDAQGRIVGISKIIRDITQNKRAEVALRRAKASADEANAAKSLFLAHMSHEIRTPLNGVVGMIDLLLGTPMTPQQRRYAQITKSSAESLTGIINDILDFSKMEAGKLELTNIEFGVGAVLEDVVQMLAPPAQQKGLDIACCVEPDLPETITGDPDRFRQVVVNLLNNAIKFTQRGTVVLRAMLEHNAEGEGLIRVTVTDTGIGIPPDRLDRLFKAFSQADAQTTRSFGGTGLGLAISKRLTELMGGTIGVTSEPGKGSMFWFTIKPQPSLSRTRAAKLESSQKFPALRVLAVDDNDTHRELVREQIASWGLESASTPNAQGAIATLTAAANAGSPFRVALVNRDLPDMNAFDFGRAVKARSDIAETVLMILVTLDENIPPEKLNETGFAGVITKPVQQSKLFDAIISAIGRSASVDAGRAHAVPALAPAAAHSVRAAAPTTPFHPAVRILLAEDNEVNQIVATELLARMGFACDVVNDGRQAVEAVAATPYDLVLMDCQMPVMDGFDATRAIRRLESAGRLAGAPGRHLPIIALTANAMKGDRDLCFDAGMDGYTSKPVDPDRLQRLMASLLNASSSEAANMALAEKSIHAGAPSIPLDYRVALEWCSGNAARAAEVLDKFERQLKEDGAFIRQLALSDTAGAESLARIAHRLFGAAALLSARALCDAASEVETTARTQGTKAVLSQIEQLQREIDCCLAYLPVAKEAVQGISR